MSEILEGLGRWKGDPVDLPYRGVAIDSRQDCRGKIFFALKGSRFDGHDFVEDAFRRGAVCAVVEKEVSFPSVLVKDTLSALGVVAKRWRRYIACKVVGITGTSGKTTTKEMIRTVLQGDYRVAATEGNQNNLVGLPLNLASVSEDTQVFVAEMGTNAPGEIERLSEIAEPDIAVITAVGESHLEGLGSLEGVFREKMGIIATRPSVLIFPDNSPFADAAASMCVDAGVRFLGVGSVSSGRYVVQETLGIYRFFVNGREYRLECSFAGRHMGFDALVALCVAELFGVSMDAALERLSHFRPVRGRFSLVRIGDTVIVDDTYNANPVSTRAALEELSHMRGEKIFVLGSMLELGEHSERLHREIGECAREYGVDFMVAYGREAAFSLNTFVELGGRGIYCHTHEEIVEALKGILGSPCAILVKGSRAMAMEKVVEGLKNCSGS